MKDDNRFLLYGMAALVILNVAVFFIAAMSPVLWMPNEIASHRFFWSMDGIDQYTLHSGIRKTDFLKIFAAKYTDGIFRTRHFSYLMDILSFKFWQYLGIGFFKNYSLIALHILNAVLLGRLIFLLTGQKKVSWLGALFFLNSGIAIATLLYPFRNAKLLVVTLFLICWICVAGTKRTFPDAGFLRWAAFLTGMLLAFFTDEIAFFIFPLLFISMVLRDGWRLLWSKKSWVTLLLSGMIFTLLTYIFYVLSLRVLGEPGTVKHLEFFYSLNNYLANPKTYSDVTKAFFLYFLRRNFGHWDFTVYGALAMAAFALLIRRAFFRKHDKFIRNLTLATGGIIIIKALLLPHFFGIHEIFMPPGTVFPSLLFFSYYYPYADSLLVALSIILLLCRPHMELKQINFLLFLILIIGVSNTSHLRHGPKDALAFHESDKLTRQYKVKRAMLIKKVLSRQKNPVYLSFPSGDRAVLRGKFGDGEWTTYASYIPVMYLRALEEGRALVSLDNIGVGREENGGNELLRAKTFFDVDRGRAVNLEEIKQKNKLARFSPTIISEKQTRTVRLPQRKKGPDTVVFFIKGRAGLNFLVGGKRLVARQTYGQSYQMFLMKLPEENRDQGENRDIQIAITGGTVHIIGPLLF